MFNKLILKLLNQGPAAFYESHRRQILSEKKNSRAAVFIKKLHLLIEKYYFQQKNL